MTSRWVQALRVWPVLKQTGILSELKKNGRILRLLSCEFKLQKSLTFIHLVRETHRAFFRILLVSALLTQLTDKHFAVVRIR